jgi:hypothetical protein
MARKRISIMLAIAAGSVVIAPKAQALTNFTPGDLVVLQGGDSVNTQTVDTGTVPAYLDEYSITGTLEGQVPISDTGANALTLDNIGSFNHEGVLTLSENHQLLTFEGYNGAAGTTTASNYATGTIGTIGNSTSTLNTTTTFADDNQTVRAATTIDGNEFWVALAHGLTTSAGGLNYISGTGPTASQTVLGGLLDARSTVILGGSNLSTAVLVSGSGSSSFEGFGGTGHGVFGLTGSSGPPTTSSISGSQINNDASDGSDMVFTNEPGDSNSYHGYNTMYLSGNTSAVAGFVEKYSYNGTVFAADGPVVDTVGSVDPIGITTMIDPSTGNVDVFYTEPTGIYELTAPDNSTETFNAAAATLVVANPTGAAFYGIANAPVAVPEPASISLLALGGSALLMRKRRRA